MHGQSLARFIVGVVGNVISLLLFLSPGPTFLRIWKNKSTEEFHPYPYLASMMNCMFWVFYGLPVVHPDSILVISINSTGLLLESIYLTLFLCFTTKKNRMIIAFFLLGEIALFAVVAVFTLFCFHSHASRSMFVGIICVVCGIIMYGSPLSVIGQVIRSKNPEFMPFWVCLAGFLNGIVWFIYAFLKSVDPYIATGNGIGAAFGLFQLSVYVYYSVKAKRSDSVQVKEGEILT
ncbi:Nodulin MtN3 family protein [Perilla frutescens var. hirtella]|uniref:Bidirectional sugar transporter SWEET n=1 Tax=Perilla frutescens var. hirtella TaxID=608512 RepID=A0AAD4J7P7_PERFH|nr:Nodulin MtN3 family protein [Perilla frutescens var. hirtella]